MRHWLVRRLKDWWRLDGKIVAYQLILLLLILGPVLKVIPQVKDWLPDDRYSHLFLAAALFLLLQIIMALVSERPTESPIIIFNPTAPQFLKKIKKAKRLDIAFSSTETLFSYIHDTLLTSKVECRVLLRNPESGNAHMVNHLLDFEARWKGLRAANGRCKVQVRYCNNTVFRMIIIDGVEAYVGFYRAAGNRLVGANVPMIHIKAGTPFSDHLLAVANNRFEAFWSNGSDQIGERPSFV